jgi:hypothetical protein
MSGCRAKDAPDLREIDALQKEDAPSFVEAMRWFRGSNAWKPSMRLVWKSSRRIRI